MAVIWDPFKFKPILCILVDIVVQVPEVDTAVRSLTVMWDGSLVVAANNNGTCYVWRLLRGTQVLHLILLQNLIFVYFLSPFIGVISCVIPFPSYLLTISQVKGLESLKLCTVQG